MWFYDLSFKEKLCWIADYIDFIWDYDIDDEVIPDILIEILKGNVDEQILFLEERYAEDEPQYAKAQKYIKLFKEIKEY